MSIVRFRVPFAPSCANHSISSSLPFSRSSRPPFRSLCQRSARSTPVRRTPLTFPSCRGIHVYAKVQPTATPSQSLNADYLHDERIGVSVVHFVDTSGKLQQNQPLQRLLASIDRQTEHIRKVSDSADGVPICKVISKEKVVEELKQKEVAAKRKDIADLTKQIEMAWSISENDLGYRLRKLEEFLGEGRRVEIMIAPKKRGRRAEPEEIAALLEKIRDTVKSVEDAEEWKSMDGQPGKQVLLYFQGAVSSAKDSSDQSVDGKDEKMKKKELEKRERREKQQERERKKQQMLDDRAKTALRQ